MKISAKFTAFLLAVCLLTLPASAMESRVSNMPLLPGISARLTVEDLERRLGMEEGELLSLTFLTVPEQGQLLAGGVEVERGETLLRRELVDLRYVSVDNAADWFAVLPSGGQVCGLFNLNSVLESEQ